MSFILRKDIRHPMSNFEKIEPKKGKTFSDIEEYNQRKI